MQSIDIFVENYGYASFSFCLIEGAEDNKIRFDIYNMDNELSQSVIESTKEADLSSLAA